MSLFRFARNLSFEGSVLHSLIEVNNPTRSSIIHPPNMEDIPLKNQDWMAECLSTQPDLSLVYRGPLSSWDALCLLYLVSHVAPAYWNTESLVRRIVEKAYSSNYEGEWQTVQVFLERNPQTPKQFYELFLSYKSPEEFFGNLKRRAARLSLGIKCQKRESSRKPVRVPQRKRGYEDKGTYRPPHDDHGIPPSSDEKKDYRHHVGHPLLKGEEQEPGEDSS